MLSGCGNISYKCWNSDRAHLRRLVVRRGDSAVFFVLFQLVLLACPDSRYFGDGIAEIRTKKIINTQQSILTVV